MDAILVIGGVADTVYRNAVAAEMHEVPGGFWVAAPAGEVYGGFLYSDGVFAAPLPSLDQLKYSVIQGAQLLLDEFARSRGYDDILSACSYASSAVPSFAAEGQRCMELRDQMWTKLNQMLMEVESGKRPVPAKLDDVLIDLPVLAW